MAADVCLEMVFRRVLRLLFFYFFFISFGVPFYWVLAMDIEIKDSHKQFNVRGGGGFLVSGEKKRDSRIKLC